MMKRSLLKSAIAAIGLGSLSLVLLNGVSRSNAAEANLPPVDEVPFAGLSAEEAANAITAPKGFSTKLFAGEPDVRQPIAFAIDDRGRLWVAEGHTYPRRAPEGQGRDQILIFEDTNGDHRYDKRTVFMDKLNLISGLEVGFGGVWVGAAPYLMFIPDRNRDDKPDSEPQILLDGWDFKADTHETLNTFTWGPDGWLYGCHGVFCPSLVGKPGAPETERQWVDAAVWRYHPTKHQFEVFAEGGSNPWGIDFDEYGQCVIEACVIPHLWHMIQGGRYQRQGGEHYSVGPDETRRNVAHKNPRGKTINPYFYDDIKTIGDHVHYAGNQGPHAANNRSDAAGGGHAHAGLMVYLGDSWPEQYRGNFFMNNIHGQRINMDVPERRGSGFIGKHGPDFLNFNDAWSQVLNLLYDQDGSVYMIDWYDKNQCHHGNEAGHDRSNGRIFKVVYGDTGVTQVDLHTKSDAELVALQLHPNEWYVRHARRVLQERGPNPAVRTALREMLAKQEDPRRRLRALWALHATGGLDEALLVKQFDDSNEYVRAWAIQLLAEDRNPSSLARREFARLASEDPSPVVRLYLASALQRTAVADRRPILEPLLARADDAQDHNLPLMYWYATEGLVAEQPESGLELIGTVKIPVIRTYIARRLTSGNPIAGAEPVVALVKLLSKTSDTQLQLNLLQGISDAFRGRRQVPMPNGWPKVEEALGRSPDAAIRTVAQSLAVTFGSERAFAALRETLVDRSAGISARRTALESLVNARDRALAPVLHRLLEDSQLRAQALRALGAYDNERTPEVILGHYQSLTGPERRDALNTLASRVAFAKPLLSAVGRGTVPARDLTAEVIRQLRNLRNAEIDGQLRDVWGVARESSADKQQQIQKYRGIYRAGGSQPGDAVRGRLVFARVCQQCHVLFDTGGKVGPDLTGSARGDLDYILQNMVDPNAVIPNEYRTSTIETTDDRILTGIVQKQDDRSITIATANETLVIPRNEIRSIHDSDVSMMPEGLLDGLVDQEVRDLIYYLSRQAQVPLKTADQK